MGKIDRDLPFDAIDLGRPTDRTSALPMNLPPRGLSRSVAAAYIGVGGSKFNLMVREGSMPKPRVHGARRL